MAKFEQWITADALVLLEGWARDGLTDELIAGKMGIGNWELGIGPNPQSPIPIDK